MTKLKRVLITGATGFLGSHVTRNLIKKGFEVGAIVRGQSNCYRLSDCLDSIKIYNGSLEDDESINITFADFAPEIVIHCAAYGVDYQQQDIFSLYKVNVAGTLSLFVNAVNSGVKRFIHVGSCFEYGLKGSPISETDPIKPLSGYGVSKAAATMFVLQHGPVSGLPVVVLRPFGMYGPYEGIHRIVPHLIVSLLKNRRVDLTMGDQIRDYTYVADVADAFVKLAAEEKFPAGEVLNVGSGVRISIRQLGTEVANLLGKTHLLNWGALPYRLNEPKMVVSNSTKIYKITGWRASTTLISGLNNTISYYKNNNRE